MKTQSKKKPRTTSLTPEQAFKILKEVNQRFVNNLKANRNLLANQVNETSNRTQFPFATILRKLYGFSHVPAETDF